MKENADKHRALDTAELQKNFRESAEQIVPAEVPDVDGADGRAEEIPVFEERSRADDDGPAGARVESGCGRC